MHIQWFTAVDVEGQTLAVADNGRAARLYYPNSDARRFRHAGGGGWRVFDGPIKFEFTDIEPGTEAREAIKEPFGVPLIVASTRQAGEYHPRIWNGPESPELQDVDLLEAWLSAARAARIIYAKLRSLFLAVEPSEANANAYGHEFRQLLILACTEVEAAWRAVLAANGYAGNPERWRTSDYHQLLPAMRLDAYAVSLSAHPSYGVLQPFLDWNASAATKSLHWYDAYNKTKHDREGQLSRATLHMAIEASAALFIMIHAQFGPMDRSRAFFHEEEFTMVRHPRRLEDWYIRPLPAPGTPRDPWPRWHAKYYPWPTPPA